MLYPKLLVALNTVSAAVDNPLDIRESDITSAL